MCSCEGITKDGAVLFFVFFLLQCGVISLVISVGKNHVSCSGVNFEIKV